MTTPYDALTLELERVETLALFLEDQLSDLSDTGEHCYALSLIARNIADRCQAQVLDKARALLASTTATTKRGAR